MYTFRFYVLVSASTDLKYSRDEDVGQVSGYMLSRILMFAQMTFTPLGEQTACLRVCGSGPSESLYDCLVLDRHVSS